VRFTNIEWFHEPDEVIRSIWSAIGEKEERPAPRDPLPLRRCTTSAPVLPTDGVPAPPQDGVPSPPRNGVPSPPRNGGPSPPRNGGPSPPAPAGGEG
jgi:hypothetical protein